jgi:hypothetical protein
MLGIPESATRRETRSAGSGVIGDAARGYIAMPPFPSAACPLRLPATVFRVLLVFSGVHLHFLFSYAAVCIASG